MVVFRIVTSPALWLVEVVTQPTPVAVSQGVVGELESGAPRVLKSTPAEAVVSLATTVLLKNFTANASSIETPPPSHPATLFVMMLLVMVTSFHRFGLVGVLAATSWPFTPCNRMPPPPPLSAVLPMIRLALITRPRPVPSLSPGGQSWSFTEPHSVPAMTGSGDAPSTAIPPPLVGMVGLLLWLNRIQLLEILPFKLNPLCTTPPPSPVLRLPHTQL